MNASRRHRLNPASRAIRFSTTKMNSAIVAYTQSMSRPSGSSDATPKVPIVYAIAPNAPIGATTITSADDPEEDLRQPARASAPPAGPRGPSDASATPNRTTKNTTCRMSPFANASTTLDGTMCVRKSTKRSSFALRGERRDVAGGDAGGVDPLARTQDVHDDQPDGERERRHDLEVEQRLAPDPADPLEVRDVRDAEDDREEDDRRDDHPHQVHERVADGLHGPAGVRPERTDQRPERDGHEHADGEVAAEAGQPGGCHGVRRS